MFYLRRLRGQSMSPTLKDGQLVLLRSQSHYRVHQIVAVQSAGDFFLKRLKIKLGSDVYLEGDHPDGNHLLVDADSIKAAFVCRLLFL